MWWSATWRAFAARWRDNERHTWTGLIKSQGAIKMVEHDCLSVHRAPSNQLIHYRTTCKIPKSFGCVEHCFKKCIISHLMIRLYSLKWKCFLVSHLDTTSLFRQGFKFYKYFHSSSTVFFHSFLFSFSIRTPEECLSSKLPFKVFDNFRFLSKSLCSMKRSLVDRQLVSPLKVKV